jgi:hypothetical protein
MSKKAKIKKGKFPTKKSVGDAIHTIAKVGVGMIPLVNVPASELLNCLVTPPLEKRKNEFFEDVGRRLKDLEDQGVISLEKLSENEKFIDVTMLATQAALRTSEKEKRTMLRNAIIKSAKPVSPELAIQQMFINYVDYFTVWHIKILAFVSDPLRWAKNHNHEFKDIQAGGLAIILEDAFPNLRGGRGFYDQFWKDLHSRSLVKQESLQKAMTKSTLMDKNTTNTGEKFLIYISDEQGNIT